MATLPAETIRERMNIPNYGKSSEFTKRMTNATIGPRVEPVWVGENDKFWYRRCESNGRSSFVLVDPANGERKPAFDHVRLARQLKNHGIDSPNNAFSFNMINLDLDSGDVTFHADGKRWEFRSDGSLNELEIIADQDLSLQPLISEKPSEDSGVKSMLTIVNKRLQVISVYWIDREFTPRHYCDIQPGQTSKRPTYVGHVWRITDAKTQIRIHSFEAPQGSATVLITNQTDEDHKLNGDNLTLGPVNSAPLKNEKITAFIKDSNIWIRDIEGKGFQLSQNGNSSHPFEEKNLYLSEDQTHLIGWQHTLEQERLVSVVDVKPSDCIQPRLKQYQYLKPGDHVRRDRPRLFALATRTEVPTNDSQYHNPFELSHVGWSPDDCEYLFIYNQRGHQVLRVIGIGKNGSSRTIIEEISDTFIDYSSKTYLYELHKNSDIIWMSERTGYNHLYLYDRAEGKLKKTLTSGNWNVKSVESVDEEHNCIWLKAVGAVVEQDPYYIHLMCVSLDGAGSEILTCGDGTHLWSWSPSRRYLVDSWSRVDLPPRFAVVEVESKNRILLEKGDFPRPELLWSVPEPFAAPGRDGTTMIYGIIIRPYELDKQKTYPVIEEIYAGPHGYNVTKKFSLLITQHELAEIGFVYVCIDGMGTNWRGKGFHNHCYKNLRDAGFPDRIAWMRAAAKTRPWMDLTRVGIFGVSAGGQNALSAMLWFGDFYKAAVADCGCHDNRVDKLWWNELWMGWPVDDSYEDSSNVVHAHRLQGALLLIVGALDQNVDPASTMQVVHALNEADKDYDLLVFPRKGHIAGRCSYAVRRQRDFFVRHLMQTEPPNRNLAAS